MAQNHLLNLDTFYLKPQFLQIKLMVLVMSAFQVTFFAAHFTIFYYCWHVQAQASRPKNRLIHLSSGLCFLELWLFLLQCPG